MAGKVEEVIICKTIEHAGLIDMIKYHAGLIALKLRAFHSKNTPARQRENKTKQSKAKQNKNVTQ